MVEFVMNLYLILMFNLDFIQIVVVLCQNYISVSNIFKKDIIFAAGVENVSRKFLFIINRDYGYEKIRSDFYIYGYIFVLPLFVFNMSND